MMTENNLNVLYIEDDNLEIYLWKTILENHDSLLKVDFVKSQEEALALLEKKQYSVIVIDYNLQDVEAPEVARVILTRFPETSIIAVSNVLTPVRIEYAQKAGILACWEKGKIDRLLENIIRICDT